MFGSRDITTITRYEVKQFAFGLLAKGRSRSYVGLICAALSGMFTSAVEDGHVSLNPAARLFKRSRPGQRNHKPKVDFLTKEELTVLLESCKEHFPGDYALLLTLGRAGFRIGEAVALQWEDIDFSNRFMKVQRTFSNRRLGTPKSGKSRLVDMSQHLTDTMKAKLVERKKQTLRKGWGEVPPWVFVTGLGTRLDPETFRSHTWPKILAKAGLRYVRLHDLRHTFASHLIQNSESLAYVKDQMGHSSIQITVDTYGHLVPGGNRAAVDRLDEPVHATIRNPGATRAEDGVLATPVSYDGIAQNA
ncbi:MAG: tyrosine-type recombinase/integrase [Candidatus Binatia bacterium]